MHEPAHFTADSDELLLEKILGHFAEYHPEITEDQVRELVGSRAYEDVVEQQPSPGDGGMSLDPVIRPAFRPNDERPPSGARR